MKRVRYVIYAAVAAGLVAAMFLSRSDNNAARVLARETHADGRLSVDLLSEPYKLDRVYMSMTGPRSNHSRIQLLPGAPTDKTVWLTGVEVDVLDAKDESLISREYFCHSNVTICPESSSPEKHNKSFATPAHANWRFFTLVPGRTSVHLPPGFGVPVKNGTLLDNFTMTLNQNAGHPVRDVKIKTRIWYRPDGAGATAAPPVAAATLAASSAPAKADAAAALRPLFRRSLYVYQQHAPTATQAAAQSTSAGVHEGELCGEACKGNQKGKLPSTFQVADKKGLDAHPGASCCVENATQDGIVGQFGSENGIL